VRSELSAVSPVSESVYRRQRKAHRRQRNPNLVQSEGSALLPSLQALKQVWPSSAWVQLAEQVLPLARSLGMPEHFALPLSLARWMRASQSLQEFWLVCVPMRSLW